MQTSPVRRSPIWAIITVLILAELALSYEITMIFAALPLFNRTFGDPVKVGWLVTGFMLVSAASAAIGSRLGDIYGRRRIVLIALALATVGSTVSAFSDTLTGVFIGRTLQGCAACVLPLCIGLMREHLPPKRVAFGVGLILASAALGTGSGNLVGGYIVDHYSWQTLFYFSAGLAAIAWISVALVLPVRHTNPLANEQLDVIGGVLFVPGIAGLLYASHEYKDHGFSASTFVNVIALFSVCILAAWYLYERNHSSPLIDVRRVFSGQVGLANLAMLLIAASAFQSVLIGSMLIQQPLETGSGFGMSATFFGSVLLPGAVLGVLAAPFAGYLAARWGARKVLLLAAAANIGIWLSLAIFHHNLWLLITQLTVLAVLGAMLLTSIPNLIIENVELERTGEFVGFAVVVRHLFGGIGAQMVVTILASSTVPLANSSHTYPSPLAYSLLFFTLAALAALATLVIFLVRSPRPDQLQSVSLSAH